MYLASLCFHPEIDMTSGSQAKDGGVSERFSFRKHIECLGRSEVTKV